MRRRRGRRCGCRSSTVRRRSRSTDNSRRRCGRPWRSVAFAPAPGSHRPAVSRPNSASHAAPSRLFSNRSRPKGISSRDKAPVFSLPRHSPLREAIAEYLTAARAVRCRPEQIVLTSGTRQGLSLAARILIDPGDPVWVEDSCYRSAVEILRSSEARIVPVPVDASGLDIAIGERINTSPPRLVYTTPSRRYPLGMAMPFARRRELLDRAGRVIYLGRPWLEQTACAAAHADDRPVLPPRTPRCGTARR